MMERVDVSPAGLGGILDAHKASDGRITVLTVGDLGYSLELMTQEQFELFTDNASLSGFVLSPEKLLHYEKARLQYLEGLRKTKAWREP